MFDPTNGVFRTAFGRTRTIVDPRQFAPAPTLDSLVAQRAPKSTAKAATLPNHDRLAEVTRLANEAGFTSSAKEAQKTSQILLAEAKAEEFYDHLTQSQINKFNHTLRATTERPSQAWGVTSTYQALTFVQLHQYPDMPPVEVLLKVKEAKERGLFHILQVAYITELEVRKPDPIVFGRINGSLKYFIIAQWGDDVKVSDILAAQ